MTSQLEQLPPEVLEQIGTQVPRSARGVSRTLRAATQRRFEQLCHDPISKRELAGYFRIGPMSLALFPKLPELIRQLERTSINVNYLQQCNIYHLVNPPFTTNTREPNLIYTNTFIEVARFPESVSTIVQIMGHLESRLIKELRPAELVEQAQNLELDLLTQWRILTARAGCPEMDRMTRSYLQAGLDQMRHYFLEIVDEWLARDDDVSKQNAFYLLVYFQTYLYINASLLNIWPLQWDWDSYTTSGIDIDILSDPEENQDTHDFFLQAINNLYSKIVRAIQRLEVATE
jgi:hypothetical protein